MKYLYSFLLMAVVTIFSSSAATKTFTIKPDEPDRVIVRDPGNGYQPVTWNNGEYTITTDETNSLPVQTTDRQYVLASITDKDGNNVSSTPSEYFPVDGTNLEVSKVPDGSIVTITTQVKEAKKFTFIGNPAQVSISMDYAEQAAVDGQWVLTPGDYSSITISAKPGAVLRSVTDSYGSSLYVFNNSVNVYSSNYSTDQTFTIVSVDEAEVRTAAFTVVVEGSYGDVQITRDADYYSLSLTGESTEIKFDPATETTYSFSHVVYGKTLYSVTVNDTPAERRGSSWGVTVSNGDVVKVVTNYPDVDVPVSFTFTNEGTEGLISAVRVNGQNVYDWNTSTFSVKLGSSLYVETNTSDYEITSATLNGQSISPYPAEYSVTSTDALNFVYTATKAVPYTVKVETDCPEGLVFYNGYSDYYPQITAEFDADGVATFEIPKSNPYLCIAAANGYFVSAIESGSNTYQPNSGIYITSDMEFFVSAAPITRENTLTLYVQPGSWNYRNFSTAYGNYAISRSFQDDNLPFGYNRIEFGAVDFPFYFSGYPALYIYHNGEELTPEYGSVYVQTAADGDVIKMFYSEPAKHTVTYTIAEGVEVEVLHDLTAVVATPSTHTVVGDTQVDIIPGAEALIVKSNGTPLELTDGKYTANVSADTEFTVERDVTTAVEGISTVNTPADNNVYNLQGMRVSTNGTTKGLPAGIYIVNGKKVRL